MKPKDKKYIFDNIDTKSIAEIAGALGLKERAVRKFLEAGRTKERQRDEKEQADTRTPVGMVFAAIILIAIAGCIVYSSALSGKFILDDILLIQNNVYLQDPSYIPALFTKNISAGVGMSNNFYRPLQMLTYLVEYSLWGDSPVAYHVTNILFHILAACAVYWLISILFGDHLLALLTGLFFAVHPMHTEAVTYIAGRADPMVALFVLLCLIFYIKHLNTNSVLFYLLMLASYGCALLSKEYSFIVPVFLLVYHVVFRKKFRPVPFFSILSMLLIYMVCRAQILSTAPAQPTQATTVFKRLPSLFVALTEYMRIMLIPTGLHMEYGVKFFHFSEPRVLAGLGILVVLLCVAFLARNKNNILFFSLVWFLVGFIPVSNLFPLNAFMAEHWLYVPSIGFFLLLSYCAVSALTALKDASGSARAGHLLILSLIASLFVFYGIATFRQNAYWKDPLTFHERTLRYVPDSTRSLKRLGQIYFDMGRRDEGVALFKKAVTLNPTDAVAYNDLGVAHYAMGRTEEAIAAYEKAITYDPKNAQAYYNFGNLYKALRDYKRAIGLYQKAIESYPLYVTAYVNCGISYASLGERDRAIECYRKAIGINPRFAPAHVELAKEYYRAGNYRLAIEHADQAAALGYADPRLLSALKPYRGRLPRQ
ncbi:MAG: tetratricopeptide repeat protein [Candidatus Omnitrophica bacterium]|nr:tetratricopeptide repeat protein [Candidatus Omnitrophota bacterium]